MKIWKILFSSVLIGLAILIALFLSCGDDSDDDFYGDDDDDYNCGAVDDCADGDNPGSDTWTDSSTSLMWQNEGDIELCWEEARCYCEKLCWGGYSDWRMPTISELRSLIRGCPDTEMGGSCGVTDECYSVQCSSDYPTNPCDGCEDRKGPGFEGKYWPEELVGNGWRYWTSSPVKTKLDEYDVWFIHFNFGYVKNRERYSFEHVRCVR